MSFDSNGATYEVLRGSTDALSAEIGRNGLSNGELFVMISEFIYLVQLNPPD